MTIMNDVIEMRDILQQQITEVPEDSQRYFDLSLASTACRLAVDNPSSTSLDVAIALRFSALVLHTSDSP